MKKITFRILKIMTLGIASVLTITSCGENVETPIVPGPNPPSPINPDPPEPVHEHIYNQEVVSDEYLATPATYFEPATYYYSCECGEYSGETFSYGDVLTHEDHNFSQETIKEATLEENGLVRYTCKDCGYSYEEELTFLGKGFEVVEYIESTGTQFIDSGVGMTLDTKIECEGLFTSAFQHNAIYGVWSSLSLMLIDSDVACVAGGGAVLTSLNVDCAINTKYKIVHEPGTLTINDDSYDVGHKTGHDVKDGNIMLFGASDAADRSRAWAWTSYGQCRIYSFKITNNEQLVRHFIPAKRTSDGEFGLFDLIEMKFYENNGTGEFITNPDFNNEFAHVDYIETTGNQIINTGVKDSRKITVDLKMSVKENKNQYWYGSHQNYLAMMHNGLYNSSELEYNFITCYTTPSSDIELTQRLDGENTIITINGETITVKNETDASNGNLYIFGCNDGNRFYGAGLTCYYFKIYSNNNLIRDFVPVRRLSDGKCGLYDQENDVFYTNLGTGSFKAPENFDRDFKAVDYIQSTGSQRINLSLPECDSWEIEYSFDSVFNEPCIIGDGSGLSKWGIFASVTRPNHSFWDMYSGYTSSSTLYSEKVKASYNYETGECSINDEPVGKKNFTQPKYLFAYNENNGYGANAKLYSCKFYKEGVLIANLIPVKRNRTAEAGLFDVINNIYYENAGLGNFSSEGSYKRVSYIESTGTQFIDTGIVGTQGTTYEADFEITNENSLTNSALVGSIGFSPVSFYYQQAYLFTNAYSEVVSNKRTRIRSVVNGTQSSIDVNGERTEMSTIATGSYSMWIFNLNYYNGVYSYYDYSCDARLYSLKIYQKEELLRDFVPVVNEINEQPGLLDLVNNTFYVNIGTGEFLYGEEESIENYEFLDSIDTTGVCGFNFFTSPQETTETEIKLKANPILTEENSIFGSSWSNNGYILMYQDSNIVFKTENITYQTDDVDVTEVNTIHTYPRKVKEALIVNDKEYPALRNTIYVKNTENTFKFIGMDNTNARSGGFTLYYFRMWERGELIHEFIPAKNKTTSKSGVYDMVEGKFYEFETSEVDGITSILLEKTTEFNVEKLKFAADMECDFDVGNSFKGSKTLANEGYKTISRLYHNERLETDEEWDKQGTIGYQLAYKRCFVNNKIVDSYVLLLQCTFTNGDAYDDIAVGEEGRRFHKGFERTADNMVETILDNLVSTKVEMNLFIAGYSRGAAVGGVLSSKLMENTPYFNEDNLSAYLIACPRYSTKDIQYDNVFAVNNPGDLVPQVPLASWGFGFEAQTIFLDINREGVLERANQIILHDYLFDGGLDPSYQGLMNADKFLKAVEGLDNCGALVYIEANEEYLNKIAKMVLRSQIDFGDVLSCVVNIIANLAKVSVHIPISNLIDIVNFFLDNQEAIGASHMIWSYKAFIYSIYGD